MLAVPAASSSSLLTASPSLPWARPSWQRGKTEEGPGFPWQEVKASLAILGHSPLHQAAWYCLSKQLQPAETCSQGREGGRALRKAPVTRRAVLKHTDTQVWEHAGSLACTAKTHSTLQGLLSVVQPTLWPPQIKSMYCLFLWVAQAGWSVPSLHSEMALRSLLASIRKKCLGRKKNGTQPCLLEYKSSGNRAVG